MKKVILLALLMPVTAFSQIVENFESGSIARWAESTEGHWMADSASSLSGRFSLHHVFDNPEAGIDQLALPIGNLHPSQGLTRWSFTIRYGYDPSSLNNWSVFLMSDNPPGNMSVEGDTRGFALGVNLTGSDDTLRLWKIDGNSVTTIINSGINWQTDIGSINPAKISIERSQEGNWTLSVSLITGVPVGTVSGFDKELFGSGWFGVHYKYSSTRDRLLWFDDLSIEGTFYEDNEAPFVTRCETEGKKTVEISLNEEPDSGIMIPENISLNGLENKPLSVIKKSSLTWDVKFANEFKNKNLNNLIFNKLCDVSANCSQNMNFSFTSSWAERGDIVISEIMADPLPQVSLPDKEYIEITNRTGYPINMKNWRLATISQFTLFPETIIPPSGIFTVCAAQDTIFFNKYGRVIGIKNFPSLTDAGRILYISDSTGILIHGVEYSADWYKDELKSNGGWSLEMVDTGFPFYDIANWKASLSKKGGTPGSVNSVSASNPDTDFLGVQNVFPQDSSVIEVSFSEPVFNLKENLKAVETGGGRITDITSVDSLYRKFSFKLGNPLQKQELYHLKLPSGITDFAGNQMQKSDFSFGLTEPAVEGDILFNEILFNPLPGDQDYLELFNCSQKIIDASRLQIITVNDGTGDRSEAIPVSDERRCLLPEEYYAITTDSKGISERYFSANPDYLFETEALPTMSDEKGHLILYNRELDKIDDFSYDDDMHYSLLSTHEGVALEKINPLNKSEERANWHSASESSGWGTPGASNSMFDKMFSANDQVKLSSSKITPDSDGNEDFLTIKMNLTGNGNVVSATVFDETGNYVRKIAFNQFAGNETSLIWDGTADDGSMVDTGIYIVLITLYNDTGKTARWKKVCTVIRN
jgi:Lamin Tail Domain/FlgD Ig-like domain/Bacterial Ig-like domain